MPIEHVIINSLLHFSGLKIASPRNIAYHKANYIDLNNMVHMVYMYRGPYHIDKLKNHINEYVRTEKLFNKNLKISSWKDIHW